jgi:gas vesicle protein
MLKPPIHQGRLTLLDVVVGQSASILELLARKDETLLVRGDSCKQQEENIKLLRSTIQPDEKHRKELYTDIRSWKKRPKLYKHQTPLVSDTSGPKKPRLSRRKKNRKKQRNCWKRTFLILDFGLHIVNSITALHLKRDRLSCQSFHKDLHLEDPREALQILKLKTGKVRSSATAVTIEGGRERREIEDTFLMGKTRRKRNGPQLRD